MTAQAVGRGPGHFLLEQMTLVVSSVQDQARIAGSGGGLVYPHRTDLPVARMPLEEMAPVVPLAGKQPHIEDHILFEDMVLVVGLAEIQPEIGALVIFDEMALVVSSAEN